MIHCGDALTVLRTFGANSVDALVTDPPAGISFMGKDWDDDKGGRDQWVAWLTEVMRECYRVMKPGAHGLVWALPRTSHWTATALEDAGFEIRDRVQHIFGSGFPKSLDVSKAIDKAAGAERAIIGKKSTYREPQSPNGWDCTTRAEFETAPATDAAKQWSGWGTALKPACEDWWLIRKPLSEKTVAANVLKWGTGALNIDASRIGGEELTYRTTSYREAATGEFSGQSQTNHTTGHKTVQGRFPSHLVLDEQAAAMLDAQSGTLKTGAHPRKRAGIGYCGGGRPSETSGRAENSGGASRFFYVAKASKKDKGADNTHPTVKSTTLMGYLVALITPPGGVVLDPLMGSGSTGVATRRAGFEFVGIELSPEYVALAKNRIARVEVPCPAS